MNKSEKLAKIIDVKYKKIVHNGGKGWGTNIYAELDFTSPNNFIKLIEFIWREKLVDMQYIKIYPKRMTYREFVVLNLIEFFKQYSGEYYKKQLQKIDWEY